MGGLVYDPVHLEPFDLPFALDQSGIVTNVTIRVSFSCHCFTEGYDPAIHKPDRIYKHGNEIRAFDIPRFQLSNGLPALIQRGVRDRAYRGQHANFMILDQPSPPNSLSRYVAFFDLKSAKGGADLAMFVQSAYVKVLPPKHKMDGRKFKLIAGAVLSGKKPW